ncbi:hypothetical protein KUCAC02_000324, partial [Chaenocephalus aceratus]
GNTSYLVNQTTWSICEYPKNAVMWHVVLFSILLAMGVVQLVLCGIQVVNGCIGCICGDCRKSKDNHANINRKTTNSECGNVWKSGGGEDQGVGVGSVNLLIRGSTCLSVILRKDCTILSFIRELIEQVKPDYSGCQPPTANHALGPTFLPTDQRLNAVCFDFSTMGVKMLQCFPFYRRCKERCKGKDCPPAEVPIEEMKPRLCSSTSCDSEGAGNLSRSSQIYFSTKARLSFRHQLDSNINAVDATY